MNEFDKINNTLLNSVNSQLLEEGISQITLQELHQLVSETEYQSFCGGWFLGQGMELPEDCTKTTNLKGVNQ